MSAGGGGGGGGGARGGLGLRSRLNLVDLAGSERAASTTLAAMPGVNKWQQTMLLASDHAREMAMINTKGKANIQLAKAGNAGKGSIVNIGLQNLEDFDL